MPIPGVEVGDGDGGDLLASLVDVEASGEDQPMMCGWQGDEKVRRTVRNVIFRRQVAQRVRDHSAAAVDVQQVPSVQREHRTRRLLRRPSTIWSL